MSKTMRTVCDPNCHANPKCGIAASIKDNKIITIEAAEFPTMDIKKRICMMGMSRLEYQYSADRLHSPLRRVGERGAGEWEPISWDEAADLFIENQRKIAAKYGAKSIAFSQYTGAFSLLTRGTVMRYAALIGGTVMGAGGIDYGVPKGLEYTFGLPAGSYFSAGGHCFTDAPNSKVILIWGGNPVVTRSVDAPPLKEAQRQGTRLICIDPVRSETAAMSDQWVSLRPGTDGALALALLNEIITSGHIDEDFLLKHTNSPFFVRTDNGQLLREKDLITGAGNDYMVWCNDSQSAVAAQGNDSPFLEKRAQVTLVNGKPLEIATAFLLLKELANEYPLAKAAEITELQPDIIHALATEFMQAKPAAIRVGFGIDRWYRSDFSARAIAALSVVTGNIGKPGGGISLNAGSTGIPVKGSAYYSPEGKLPQILSIIDIDRAVTTGTPYPIKMDCITLGNPFNQSKPNRKRVIDEYVGNLDFIVVIDHFMTDTAKQADLVLPACTIFERTDIVVDRCIQLQERMVQPEGEAKTELEIFSLLASRMGLQDYFNKTPAEYIDDMLKFDNPLFKDIDFERLQKEKVIFPWGDNTEPYYGFKDLTFGTPSARIELYNENLLDYGAELPYFFEPVEATPQNPLYKKYPLTLLSSHSKYRIHSTFANLTFTQRYEPEPIVRINPLDAQVRNLMDGGVIDVFNDRGKLKIRCQYDTDIRPGCILISEGHWIDHFIEGDPYQLLHDHSSVTSENYAYYDVLVEMRRS
jgi:molybdopterin-containing oxidoreductase family molybdopterin binding subunit